MLLGAYPHLVPLRSSLLRIVAPPAATEIVVTFEGADQTIPRADLRRPGFGEAFLLSKGYAVLSVLTESAHWYRRPDVQEALAHPDLAAFLGGFARRHSYGSSMGAFAAIAFADLLRVDNVIAMQPVSSLRADLVPWETRFRPGASLDWTGQYADACDGCATPQRVWTFFDPEDLDAPHAERIGAATGDRFAPVPVPGAKHAVPRSLQSAGLLGQAVMQCLTGADPAAVSRLVASWQAKAVAK